VPLQYDVSSSSPVKKERSFGLLANKLQDETRGALPRVRICSDGSLCCDDDVRCCDDGKGVFLDVSGVITDGVPSTTYSYGPERTAATFRMSESASSQSGTASSQSTTTVTGASSSSTTSSDDTKGSNNGLKIGLGVAIPIAALLLLGIGFWFWRRKRNAKSQASKQVGGEQSAYETSAQKYELPNTHPPAELDAGYGR
jgi:LPXTG-motif cell wall-anchored protein